MTLLVKAAREGQTIARVTPDTAGWRYVGFAAYRLETDELVYVGEPDRESCIVVLSGAVDIEAGGERWSSLGSRDSVFEDAAPYALYVPPGVKATVHATRTAEVGVASAPAKGTLPVRLIEPAQMKRSTRGKGANTRYVCDILPQDSPAESLLVVEVRTPSGHSSSYPPHKHDADRLPDESALEETYYHRLNPQQGFAFQRVYTDGRDLDETMAVENHDVVMVPRGYHPVVVPYGYDSYYLNVMAGPRREWHFHNDPAHEWIIERDAK
ncbi:5-deoxy-glucuronate isomerase [Paraburkholderia silvatlantica]|uniref:5-deoxy-glucuronate isomerase n=1 Tax=Paraburkholderia silvatlantica TaxID=321895 RepID=A0ABR6FY63_9BURK|nr:5-deoxy-glucuronate isomerase [Paraburkholderia silvatlantica]MBB2932356.1 5-deoxy-glucuronate isomerase [Paraburkholderia silvatlantica]PVY20813.1 5-deoxyglucuronate isomerase [Paraburkholderia silvatlantica]PXW25841.1 5-deoxyglucuronate isomerase [Paraburkholderia silvatlantica]